MILRLDPTIPVNCTDHGDGEAMFLIDYGLNVNSVWVVRLAGGSIKHFYSDDIRVYDNPMNGNGYDVNTTPEISEIHMPYIHTINIPPYNPTVTISTNI